MTANRVTHLVVILPSKVRTKAKALQKRFDATFQALVERLIVREHRRVTKETGQ